MKKIIYLFILPLCLVASSCTMMVKGIAKLVVKDYNDYTDTNIANLQFADAKGNSQTFGNLHKGKTVYLYVWDAKKLSSDQEQSYKLLKERFAKYPDVAFANLYLGTDTSSNAYKLVSSNSSQDFRNILKVSEPAPFIIGKDGAILAYKAPKPNDKLVVDYVLFQARSGENGTKAAKRLIRGVNRNEQFKSDQLVDWYTNHFGKAPGEKLSISLSSTN
ncbi:MAG: hypothetical protein EOO42_17530 [Flavobacteriales bacterium]|nr:MAG: hypothetical protein EOO42_17530 [Flavobacteriales bacterium]